MVEDRFSYKYETKKRKRKRREKKNYLVNIKSTVQSIIDHPLSNYKISFRMSLVQKYPWMEKKEKRIDEEREKRRNKKRNVKEPSNFRYVHLAYFTPIFCNRWWNVIDSRTAIAGWGPRIYLKPFRQGFSPGPSWERLGTDPAFDNSSTVRIFQSAEATWKPIDSSHRFLLLLLLNHHPLGHAISSLPFTRGCTT